MTYSGRLALLPWLSLRAWVRIGGFTFLPLARGDRQLYGNELSGSISSVLQSYVDLSGKPIDQCTIVTRSRASQLWSIPEQSFLAVQHACNLLALSCLVEQQFFEAFPEPYANASIFRPVFQHFSTEDDRLAVFITRRTGALAIGGLHHGQALFQRPLQAYDAAPPEPQPRFLRAIDHARTTRSRAWHAITASLPTFLLSHSDDPTLTSEVCATFSAIAFELMFASLGSKGGAVWTAHAFADLFSGYEAIVLSSAKRVRPDCDPKIGSQQSDWSIKRKWMKELYELRSRYVHGSPRKDLSTNWQPHEYLVAAAFTYPLAVKLLLERDGLYKLSEREQGACDAVDELLDSEDWGFRWRSKKNGFIPLTHVS